MKVTGTIAVRCETCGQLGFDWRTGVCLDHEGDEG